MHITSSTAFDQATGEHYACYELRNDEGSLMFACYGGGSRAVFEIGLKRFGYELTPTDVATVVGATSKK